MIKMKIEKDLSRIAIIYASISVFSIVIAGIMSIISRHLIVDDVYFDIQSVLMSIGILLIIIGPIIFISYSFITNKNNKMHKDIEVIIPSVYIAIIGIIFTIFMLVLAEQLKDWLITLFIIGPFFIVYFVFLVYFKFTNNNVARNKKIFIILFSVLFVFNLCLYIITLPKVSLPHNFLYEIQRASIHLGYNYIMLLLIILEIVIIAINVISLIKNTNKYFRFIYLTGFICICSTCLFAFFANIMMNIPSV